METPIRQRSTPCVLTLIVIAIIGGEHSSQAEGNPASSNTEDKTPSYFFYQHSEFPRDCLEVLGHCSSSNSSGVFVIKPEGYPDVFDVPCDSDGYTIIGRRTDEQILFSRDCEDYETGFGYPAHEFWLGNKKLSFLTNQKKYQLLVDIKLKDGSAFSLAYDNFRISDAHGSYTLISTGQLNETITECPANMVPGSCSCQRSCDDPDTCSPFNCHVTGSCVCPSGFLLEDGHCIPQSECGCFINKSNEATVLRDGGVYTFPNCNRRCSCLSGVLSCEENFECSPHGTCEQDENGWNCSCNQGYKGDGEQCTAAITDCQDIYSADETSPSGVYDIKPDWSENPFQVFCNMEDGGGWTVFQKQDGSENFHRNWIEYEEGFGSPGSGMWLGNKKLHQLTNQGDYELRIDITDIDGGSYYASYDSFQIAKNTN